MSSINLKDRFVSFAQGTVFQRPSTASKAIKKNPPLVNKFTRFNKLFQQPINNEIEEQA
jgi:hypothetical protein